MKKLLGPGIGAGDFSVTGIYAEAPEKEAKIRGAAGTYDAWETSWWFTLPRLALRVMFWFGVFTLVLVGSLP